MWLRRERKTPEDRDARGARHGPEGEGEHVPADAPEVERREPSGAAGVSRDPYRVAASLRVADREWRVAEGSSGAELALAVEGFAEASPEELAAEEVSDEELAEFLACDHDPAEADPVFREQLRARLWQLLRDGEIGRRQDH